MKTCQKCGQVFPVRIKIDGIVRVLASRKYCLLCSPFGIHNTKQLGTRSQYTCPCGETDPRKYYGHKRHICGACHNRYTVEHGRTVKLRIIAHLGGSCKACDFAMYPCSLDIHHTDPSKKDPKFWQHRGWSWARIEQELKVCVLLCKNCHAAVHGGYITIGV